MRDFNTPLSVEQADQEKRQQDIDNFDTVNKHDLIDIYIERDIQQLQNTLLWRLLWNICQTDHMLNHNASPGKFQEILLCVYFLQESVVLA